MIHEPVDPRLPSRSAPVATRCVSAIDEAFAAVTDADFRVDEPHREVAEQADQAETLRRQLAAIDHQQQRLTKLLECLAE